MQRAQLALLSLLLSQSLPAWADLPLTVEDLVTDRGKLKLDLSWAYANADRTGFSAGEPIAVQTGATSFVMVPTAVGERSSNRDTLVGTLGLRYGLTGKTELFGRTSLLHSAERSRDVEGSSRQRENHVADAWLGIHHQFREEDDHPAWLGFAEVALSERMRGGTESFKSFMLGFTTYKAIDPIVFSLTGGYRLTGSYDTPEGTVRHGNLLLLSPSVGFAVNDRVTLTTGIQWTRRGAERLNGQAQGINRSQSDLVVGVGYGFDRGNTLNASFRMNASGNQGAELRVNWLYTFGKESAS
ncbi:MAG: hypothetical protein Q4B17_04560 [Lautropia sp.]|nr:hypothetical protein [Lautropia sp.]